MDKTGWKTHCFGRFLVDLPPQAVIKPTYEIWGDEIERLYETPTSLAEKIDKREQELKTQKHETEGSLFIRRMEHGGGSISLLSWARPYNKILVMEDTFLVSRNQWRAFQYSGEISPTKELSAMEIADALARYIRSRASTEIPNDPGYCVEDGFIAGKEHRSESFNIGVEFPAHPGAVLELFATTQGEVEPPLLERMKGEEAFKLIGHFAGVRTLRQGQRDVGPINAEEYLIAANEDGQQLYSFAWEAPGKAESIAEPNITVGLGVLGQSVVDDEHPYRPAFKSDEEALELWDAIIASLRLRPGAA